ncbi:MAG: DUF4118 domain-containing protein [Armatimonadota bacterium]
MQLRRAFFERHGSLIAVAGVLLATLLFLPGRDHFAPGQWALLYLLLIGLVAMACGARPALVAAVLAMVAWNFFFLRPYHRLAITDPQDILTFVVFAAVCVAMGVLAGRMRGREQQARAREAEAALLNNLSAHLVSLTEARGMAEAVLTGIAAHTGAPGQALFTAGEDGALSLLHAVPADIVLPPDAKEQAAWACRYRAPIGLPAGRGDLYLPLKSSTRVEGVLLVCERADRRLYSRDEARLLTSMANLAAAFLERLRLQETASRGDAVREADRLKSTLISSVSHELKTPLAAVTAAVTSLLEEDVAWDVAGMREELQAVRVDLERLHDSIGALLDFARLEADAWEPQRDWYELGEILGAALGAVPQAARRRITDRSPDEFPPIYVDFQQLARAFGHLIENALAYSPPDTPVEIGALHLGRHAQFWVQDHGPGVPEEERARIFQKFYRGDQGARSPAGTGLGLAITAEIVHFHNGRIWVEDAKPRGARFVMHLPVAQETGQTNGTP